MFIATLPIVAKIWNQTKCLLMDEQIKKQYIYIYIYIYTHTHIYTNIYISTIYTYIYILYNYIKYKYIKPYKEGNSIV